MNCNTYFDKKIEIKEAICLMETKINELVEMYNRIDADHAIIAEKIKELEKLIDYLLGAGLAEEVKKKLEEWLADGTLAGIIGDVLNDLKVRVGKLEKINTDGAIDRFSATTKFITTLPSYTGIVNHAYSDNGTRFYILPKNKITTGVGGCLKIFGDNYQDGVPYRDLGIYFHADQAGDKGYNLTGVNWINSKVLEGSEFDKKNPDIGFSFQDGLHVGGRFTLLGATGNTVLTVGAGKPDSHRSGVFSVLEVQGNMAITNDSSIRYMSANGASASLVRLNTNDEMIESLIGAKKTYINGSEIMSVDNNKVDVKKSLYMSGNIVMSANNQSLVLKSPNGTAYKLSVADDGTLSTVRV